MYFDLPDSISILERTPSTLHSMLAGLDPAWTDATEGPETWSPYIIVGHLIHGERTDWIPRARLIRVVHDLGHIAQIARVMAKQHREAVGPWRAYLPILDR